MKLVYTNLVRVSLCGASGWLVSLNSSIWWAAVIPWAILCIWGILLTIPIVAIGGIGIGPAQSDWMSDEFVFGVFFVVPTVLALTVSVIRSHWRRPKMRTPVPFADSNSPP